MLSEIFILKSCVAVLFFTNLAFFNNWLKTGKISGSGFSSLRRTELRMHKVCGADPGELSITCGLPGPENFPLEQLLASAGVWWNAEFRTQAREAVKKTLQNFCLHLDTFK